MEYNEIAELENKIAILKEEVRSDIDNMVDGVERRKRLALNQILIGKYTRQMRTLKGLN